MTETIIKGTRQSQISALRARDGDTCQYPDCGLVLDFSITEGQLEPTIDHHFPQHLMRAEENPWTYEQIWDLSNLRLMHKKCNAKKGDRIPNEDGTLPDKIVRKFRYRRDKRASRPEFCEQCDNGHNLAYDEVCAACGSDAQRYPRWAKVRAPECDHELFWCWACSIGIVPRISVIGTAMRQADSDELGEMFDPEEMDEAEVYATYTSGEERAK